MSEEFNELYSMLSLDREDVRNVKDTYEKDFTTLLKRTKDYHVNRMDISGEYDLNTNFERYKIDEVFLNYNIANDTLDYKINLLQNYLKDLYMEKEFNEFKKNKEDKLGNNEYLEYVHNLTYRSDLVSKWFQEFMNK